MEKIKYIIEYAEDIEEKLRSFSKPVREMIRKAIEKKLTADPVAFGKPLRHSLKGYRRLRVGDYRVIYKIVDDKILVLIIDVDHRKEIYENDNVVALFTMRHAFSVKNFT